MQCKRGFLLAYLQEQGDWKLQMPGFWQHGAGLGCKVIKLMRHLNCWRMVWWVIKSLDGAINRLVFSLFVSTKDKHWYSNFLVFLSSSESFNWKKERIASSMTKTIFMKTFSVKLFLHFWYTLIAQPSDTDHKWWIPFLTLLSSNNVYHVW